MTRDWKEALGNLAASMPDDGILHDDTTPTACPEQTAPVIKPGRLHVALERKGRGGKTATIISGFDDLTDEQLRQVASQLKQALATGGSARGGEILIQGDRVADVRRYFNIK